jgi:predicted restriction endonuclease
MERFNLKKLNEVEVKEQYRVDISNTFPVLGNSDDEVDINRAWVTIRNHIEISAKESISYYELKKCKSWSAEGCSILLHQRKQANISGYSIQPK